MLSVPEQIGRGILVCPVTRERLVFEDGALRTSDDTHRYAVVSGVPILLSDPQAADRYVQESSRMVEEYGQVEDSGKRGQIGKLRQLLARDYRTPESASAFTRFLERAVGESVYLSLGGGPGRAHPELVNVNIGPFPNVDVVADVHELPYANSSVEGVFCEAGFEHFSEPDAVVREMFRVLAPGGKAYSVTPFLQAYHGYPDHFQNLTVSGHRRLLERGGLRIVDAGPCVGPLYALFDLGTVFISEYFPTILRPPMRKAWRLLSVLAGPMNRRFHRSPNAHVFASTTYCLAEKPV
ncbi:MAG: methyltransferase domain-containing protein [Acidobacteriota bacterium]